MGMYEGHWKDERPHGEGTMRFIDGGFYQVICPLAGCFLALGSGLGLVGTASSRR